ncbi:hypothetical protein BsWGS_27412 [Bradybaena similaris]
MLDKRLNTISTEDLVSTSQQKSSCLLCPCPQLTAYWTPPPSCPRRVCCCESSGKMQLFSAGLFRDAKTTCVFVLGLLVTYYVVMDTILFMRFQTVNVQEDFKPGLPDEIYSPFTHLSIKAVMNDPTSQYIFNPSAEYFDRITKFSTVFSFITPNMISLTHLLLGLVAGKFIASENLHDRRVGVLIFQLRVWLDTLDGVVYRAQNNKHLQLKSIRTSLGYYMDITCDTLGGVFMCFGILFYLFKRFDHCKQELPTFMSQDSTSQSLLPVNGHSCSSKETYSKKYLFWKVFCFGICLACAGKFWDWTVADFEDVFQVPLKDAKLSALQLETCHSITTIVIIYLWRLLEAQALLQYVLIPIVIDKLWEFLNCTQYILLIMVAALYAVTLLYVHHVRTILNL